MGKFIQSIKDKTGMDPDLYLYEQVSQGRTAAEIAGEHGVSREAVRLHLRRLKAAPVQRVWKMRKPRKRAA